mgnify:CR=1 FL=1
MKKLAISFLFSLIASISFAQNDKEVRLSFGINQSVLQPDITGQRLLPDASTASGMPISSQVNSGINISLTGAFPISKDGSWKFRTGLNFQTLRFNTLIGALGTENEYRFLFDHKLNQIDLPILISYEKEKGKFSFGGDAGIIKGIAVWGEISPLIYEISPDEDVTISEGISDPSGLVGLGKKYSLYAAPSIRYAVSETIKLEVQPFYRYQFGDKSNYEYTNKQGAPLSQYGINLGLVQWF